MSTVGALDDYLDELLGGGMPTAVTATAPAAPVKIPGDSAELEAAFEAALAEVQAQADAVPVDAPAAAPRTIPGDSAELEAAFEAALADVQARANAVPVEAPIAAVSTVPGDSAELEAAFEAALAAAAASPASAMAEPTWADVPAEPVAAAPAPEPTWDDLPDEVIYETDAAESARLAHADSPGLQAAFDVAPAPPPPARTARPAPAPAPAAPAAVPNTWQELQAQAARPPQQRRASERTSRWLRLRCGAQAYALELLKVQEVVLPVPLLALRGAAPSMLGIMNLRGQVVPVLDLCRHLGVPVTEDSAQTRIVVLEENGETLGLRVSAVEDVANLTDSQIEPPDTARICQISNELFKGIARIGSQPMILLDATRLLQ